MSERVKSFLEIKNKERRIVIVTACCKTSEQMYGLRFEKISEKAWEATWSFKIKADVAKREGFEQATIDGSFGFSMDYPGCPYCEGIGFFQCDCGKLACWDGVSKQVVCPSCKQKIELGGTVTSLSAGTDR